MATNIPDRPPGRPRAAQTEQRILEVALRMLAEHGYSRMSLDVNLECAVSAMIGGFYARYLVSSKIPADFPRELVDIVWAGIAAKK